VAVARDIIERKVRFKEIRRVMENVEDFSMVDANELRMLLLYEKCL